MRQPSIAATLLNALSPRFELHVSPAGFRFSCRDHTEVISPVLYLTGSGKKQRVAGAGDSYAPPGPHTRVDLLDPGSAPLPPLSRADALEAFIRFGIVRVSRRVLLRPTVTVTGVESIAGAFAGQETSALKKALLVAGAHRVDFP